MPTQSNFLLSLSPDKIEGKTISGSVVRRYLRDSNLWEKIVSLDHPMVQKWITNPETYPDEYRKLAIFLWGSTQGSYEDLPDDRAATTEFALKIANLYWRDKVFVHWHPLVHGFNENCPALIEG